MLGAWNGFLANEECGTCQHIVLAFSNRPAVDSFYSTHAIPSLLHIVHQYTLKYSRVRNRLHSRTLYDFIFDPHFKMH